MSKSNDIASMGFFPREIECEPEEQMHEMIVKEELDKLTDEFKANIMKLIMEYEGKTGVQVTSIMPCHHGNEYDPRVTFYYHR